MIIKHLVFVLLIVVNSVWAQDFITFRNKCKEAPDNEVAAEYLIKYSQSANKNNPKTEYKIYLAMGRFFMAKHYINPIKKLAEFNKGKKILEEVIAKSPNHLEARFYRLAIQQNIPKILNYNNLVSDKSFVIANYKQSSDTDLKIRIKNYLKL